MTAMNLHRYPSPSGGIALGKMGAGATMLKQGKTAKDYVQNGLIAMWDGIENAGWGVHDATATTWVDLSGNNNTLELKNGAHFDTNSLVSADRNKLTAQLNPDGYLGYNTIEVCGFWDSQRNSSGLICFGNSIDSARMLSVVYTAIQVRSGAYQYPIPAELQKAKNTWSATHNGLNPTPYVAGEQIQTTPVTNNWNYPNHPFGLSGSSNYISYNFVGNYYCVRLYSRALTAQEIAANYAIDKERFNLP